MWYLLVAAGAGYLATKWQNGQKPRSLCGQNGGTSPPSSPRATLKRESDSSLSDSMPTSPKIVHDPRSSFNSIRHESSTNGFHTLLGKDVSSSPQETQSTERTTCQPYLVTPVHVKREEDPLVFTSKCSLTAIDNTDNKEQQLKEELSPSPSSCCSSSSTVINSPVDSLSILQRYDGSFNFQGKEFGSQSTRQNGVFHFQRKEQKNQFNELPNQTFNGSLNSNLEGECPRDVSIMRQNHQAEPLQDAVSDSYLLDCTLVVPNMNFTAGVSSNTAAATGSRRMLDAGMHTPLSYTGKRQRDETRAGVFPGDSVDTQFSKFNAKQDTSPMFASKDGSLLSPGRSIASQRASDRGDTDSDAFVGFGLAMAVCLMVSSSKKEMDKMGKVLRETEDLVSDMRKELEERKLRSCMDEEDNDEFFTIKPHDAVQKDCITGVIIDPFNTYLKNDHCFCDDESLRSDITEAAVQNRLHGYNFEENCATRLDHVETNAENSSKHVKGGADGGRRQNNFCYFEEESDSEEEGENDCTMSMIELERKLWQVFQERQEERISELEGALELALTKLHVKEEELRWWKNRASWLMEQSFGSTSADLQTRRHLKRLAEGFEHTNEEGVRNEPQFLYGESNLSAVEGCMERAGIKDTYLNLTGHANGSRRTSSTCSVCSEEGVVSIDVRAFAHPVNH